MLPNNAMAYLKSDPGQAIPDIQFLFMATAPDARAPICRVQTPVRRRLRLPPVQLRRKAAVSCHWPRPIRGHPIRIQMNFLATENDRKAMRTGLRMVREVLRQPALQPFVERELFPGPAATSDADLDAYGRATAITVYHPLGTCKMGPDSDASAVVDPELRVRGVEGCAWSMPR